MAGINFDNSLSDEEMEVCETIGINNFQMLRTLSHSFTLQETMPVDYTTYLLSTSPPASMLEQLLSSHCDKIPTHDLNRNVFSFSETAAEVKLMENEMEKKPPKSIIQRCNSYEEEEVESSSGCSSGRESPTPPSPKGKKRVSFADNRGFALATVKIMTEPSDVPPRLRPEILESITQGATAGVCSGPPLILDFKQPASDYLSFRDKLEKYCVSLENVIIRDYTVLGTVKVKNLSFEKKVILRCTFDSWETHMDVESNYVPYSETNSMYDTFSFEFEVPTNFDQQKKMEFAVCFEADGKQLWDNNEGKNYKIFSADAKASPQEDAKPVKPVEDISKLRNVESWTQFAPWNKVDTSLPYW
ncbi:protein phosphatase 1 regulatory subunit 3B-like isoform X3 [Saccostrea echinata]|uniref:protein phosphatase 1 regulatory subunit 3B-like isoform X3 n=1 Tax=Saccostrea echinata TaxID=191078 RepID=UPI002A812821|nr:protein phosphatase 1 regulatory subunit 3B-like isoform X3 [Saccostrea echinata]